MKRDILNRRSGFTMIELLVVMAVIAILASVLVAASFRFVVSARESATAATINKVNGIIQDRLRSLREMDFTDEAISTAASWNINYAPGNLLGNPTDQIMTPNLADVIVRKVRIKKSFPQAFFELDSSQLARFFPTYQSLTPKYPTGGTTGNTPTFNQQYESGIVLYAVIMNGETFGIPTPGADTFTSAEIKNSSETGNLPCLVDAWGAPLRFYRSPTRLIRCGEGNFSNSKAASGYYDDVNQNGVQDLAGWVEGTPPSFSPAIRPNVWYPAVTPASVLISNLAQYNPPIAGTTAPSAVYGWGPDQYPGTAGGTAPMTYAGFPDTDDPEPLNIDPDDPMFQLSIFLFDANLSSAQIVTRRASFVSTFHDFYTYQTPLIVSQGSDRQLGLYEPWDIGNYGYLCAPILTKDPTSHQNTGWQNLQYLYDNITNLNQRVGGK